MADRSTGRQVKGFEHAVLPRVHKCAYELPVVDGIKREGFAVVWRPLQNENTCKSNHITRNTYEPGGVVQAWLPLERQERAGCHMSRSGFATVGATGEGRMP